MTEPLQFPNGATRIDNLDAIAREITNIHIPAEHPYLGFIEMDDDEMSTIQTQRDERADPLLTTHGRLLVVSSQYWCSCRDVAFDNTNLRMSTGPSNCDVDPPNSESERIRRFPLTSRLAQTLVVEIFPIFRVEFHRSRDQRRLTADDCRDLIDAAVAQALLA